MKTGIKTRRLVLAAILLGFACSTWAQNVTLKYENTRMEQVLAAIKVQTGYSLVFSDQLLDVNRMVSINVKNKPLKDVVAELLTGTNLTSEIKNQKIYFVEKKAVLQNKNDQQRKRITGVVKDSKGEVIIGANVSQNGTKSGTITDAEGHFRLDVSVDGNLQVSYIGYKSKNIAISSNKIGDFTIILQEDTEILDEVVVTALGIKREEKALGYSVQKISGDKLSTVKSVDFATNLTGKIAGLNVSNSTEFNRAPNLSLRGEAPLIVVDGVPYTNLSLRDIAADDIESVDVLKGATASALYGARGGSGAIMITTKRGKVEGLQVEINNSTMINAGYLRKPEVQTSYSTGQNGKYLAGSYVWGDKMDIGREAEQYNPFTYQLEKRPLVSAGKDNLKNFQQFSFVTNTNVNVTQKGKYGSFRTSLTHVYNKGQWPNEKLNKITYTVSGDMTFGKFKSDAGITYNKRFYPNMGGTGYGGGGYLYNLLIWSGADFDIRDYKNYWQKKDELSNWMDRSWYENPYYIANEITSSNDYNVINGFINGSYEITPWMKVAYRSGLDFGTNHTQYQTPVGATAGWGSRKGYYGVNKNSNFSINNDLMLIGDYKAGDFAFDGILGGSIYYLRGDGMGSNTENGLIIPGYYSLNASVDPAKTSKSYSQKQINSLYGKLSASWKSTVFVDVTGRNDWTSTLPSSTRSYFYPSVAASVVMSEFIPVPDFVNFWKIRGSWTVTKKDPEIYSINNVYSISTNVWDNMTAAYSSTSIKDAIINPATSRSYEFGTAFHLFDNRLSFDVAYYNKLNYNNIRSARISSTTGYDYTLINYAEEQVRKGFEVTIFGDIIKSKDLTWDATFNWARDRYYYGKVDPVYSTKKTYVAEGKRYDWLDAKDYQRDPSGNIIHGKDGMPLINPVPTLQGFTSPNWVFGLSTSLTYKNLTVDLSIDGKVGGIAHATIDQAMWNSGAHIDSDNQYRYDEVVNKKQTFVGKGVKVVSGSAEWDVDGNIIRDDRVYAPNDKVVSYETYVTRTNPYIGEKRTQNLLDKTFIKLRNLAVSYSLPQKFCSRLSLKQASVGVVGQNLLMWTKDFKFSDPDIGSDNINSPSIRYVGFNLKLNF